MHLKASAQSITRRLQLVTHEVLLAWHAVMLLLLAIFLAADRDDGMDGER